MEKNKIYLGDNLELMTQLEDNSIDSCVSDFPYNLGFMGKKWDNISNYHEWCFKRAKELLRVLKPGGFCLIFGGTRTHHCLVCAFEDAGFIIRDEISWVYSSGFPKSYNVSKGFDKKVESDLAKQWDGWGTALKPAQEPIMVAQKPLDGNYCDNIEKWGIGALNIDDSRIPIKFGDNIFDKNPHTLGTIGENGIYGSGVRTMYSVPTGRFPANIIFDEDAGKMLDQQSGITKSGRVKENKKGYDGNSTVKFIRGISTPNNQHGDTGGASRFFYCAKASNKDRTEYEQIANDHPTVKPSDLIKYLVRLVTPQNGICLDICEGSGTHAKACVLLTKEDYPINYIGFENDKKIYETSIKRVKIVNEY